MKTKRCSACKNTKNVETFGKNELYPDGLWYYCKECVSIKNKKFNAADPLRNIHKSMMNRCHNKMHHNYKSYGGRGITVFKEWHDFYFYKIAIEALGDKPTQLHTIDRINNDLGYLPGNLRWADKFTQAINTRKRKDNKSGVRGVWENKAKGKWEAYITRNRHRHLIGRFTTKDLASSAREQWVLRNESNKEYCA